MSMSFTLTRERPELWRVTFDNPPTNLVDPAMILQLQSLLDQVEADRDVSVVIFDSTIAGHFLGPYDMTQAAHTPTEPGPTGLAPWLDVVVRLTRLPAVSIAVIRGACRGVGNEFALACDLRFASIEKAVIDQPELRAGVVPGGGAISRLPPLVGRARALEVILGSGTFDGALAERYGLVNRALPDHDLDEFVNSLASNIAGYDRWVLTQAKALINGSTLPAETDLVVGYETFFASVARNYSATP
jgi:enoyl-CoA hydratase/carnithine racemase